MSYLGPTTKQLTLSLITSRTAQKVAEKHKAVFAAY